MSEVSSRRNVGRRIEQGGGVDLDSLKDKLQGKGIPRRVARFFLIQYTKTRENITIYHNIIEWPDIVPNGRKIFRRTIKYTSIFHSKAPQIWIFWFENKPSGNPDSAQQICFCDGGKNV
jgi:hypothetical protein